MLEPVRVAYPLLCENSNGELSCCRGDKDEYFSNCNVVIFGSLGTSWSKWQLWPPPAVGDVKASPLDVSIRLASVPPATKRLFGHKECHPSQRPILRDIKSNLSKVQIVLRNSELEHFKARVKECKLEIR